jgi:Flp pilus assembly protein TadG
MTRYCTSNVAPPPGGRFAKRFAKRLKDARGANIVEMAIVMPLLFLLTFSIVDFGSLFYAYLALENGVSQAARYGVTGNVLAGKSREESIRAAMREAAPTLTFEDGDFTFSHLVPGGAVWQPGSGEPGDVSKVEVTHRWKLMTPFIAEIFASNMITITVESAMLNEPRFD